MERKINNKRCDVARGCYKNQRWRSWCNTSIYHGGRQLDSATTSIEALPLIRNALGKDFPIIFDSGIRGGSDIVRALGLGADFTMVGRPLMYGIGADGAKGLKRIVDIIKEELSTTLGLVGLNDIKDISSDIIAERFIREFKY